MNFLMNNLGIVYLGMLFSLILISMICIGAFIFNKEKNKIETIWLVILNIFNIPVVILTFRLTYSFFYQTLSAFSDVFITRNPLFKTADLFSIIFLLFISVISFLTTFHKFSKVERVSHEKLIHQD